MGLLDGLLQRTGSVKPADSGAISNIFDLINNKQVGGLDGLLGKMSQGGLGNIANSWISTGKNKSVKAGQLANILGSDAVAQLASKLGISNAAAAAKLAKFLPLIVDKLTPDGKVTSGQSVNIQDILGKLMKK